MYFCLSLGGCFILSYIGIACCYFAIGDSTINGKTKCSVFTKHFVRNLALLTQNKMCILLQKK